LAHEWQVLSELREKQEKLRELVSAVPELLPGVTVSQKEATFQQLAELLAAAEQPIALRWYQAGKKASAAGGAVEGGEGSPTAAAGAEAEAVADATVAGGPPDAALDEWVGFVTKQLRFLFHAADSSNLPVPSALEARLLRQASLIDGELTAQMLRAQLVQRVLLFAPEGERLAHDRLRMRPPQRPQIVALTEKLEAAVKQLTAVTPPAR
jgi:hypothetical protein